MFLARESRKINYEVDQMSKRNDKKAKVSKDKPKTALSAYKQAQGKATAPLKPVRQTGRH
jgi:hypothetical protein